MAAASARPERAYHQDYIARIRYSNALPPPPNPPKLLEIPNTGLSSGHYVSAGFVSRLAREQPLNIEADAELGMPIDLIGLPGVLDGDESAIYSLENPPPPHPHDKPLLRPLAALGKPSSGTTGVSFLRRTEYISSDPGRTRFEGTTSKDLLRPRANPRQKRKPDVAKDDPINIIRSIVKGFDVAYPEDAYKGPDTSTDIRGAEVTAQERDAWDNPRHPSKSDVTLLDSYPILPDLDAIPDTGAFIITKFSTNPVAASDMYDTRLDVAFLRPTEQTPESIQRLEAAQIAQATDPSVTLPQPQYNYEFYLPRSSASVLGIKRKFSVDDPEKDHPALYDAEMRNGQRCFRYDRVREYETYQQAGDLNDYFGDNVAFAMHDPETDTGLAEGAKENMNKRLQKAAYFYPVLQRTFIRPKRKTGGRMLGMPGSQVVRSEDQVDAIEAVVRDPDEDETTKRQMLLDKYNGIASADASAEA